ncbi:hypothetical protein [Treponema brennaborense]|uniref:Uncharacterized protein n=1 Tax=Treponema brennaborense (strain DSM 12168 / CIP 105900 / DD5/3) TaxID=906968 RepID=F4LJY1_TREBD|nr:hypothetical protein [Treponema brennaborense]AEE16461.1 hypothetical protein Trebr_1027 [Treponema brennaborense DSM 12168]
MKRQPADILLVSDSAIELDMNMDGRDFAQARLMPYLEEKGYVAVPQRRIGVSAQGEASAQGGVSAQDEASAQGGVSAQGEAFAQGGVSAQGGTAVPHDFGTWSFTPWTFTQTHELDGYIRVTGSAFAGKPLLSLFDSGTDGECGNAVRAVCSALEAAIAQHLPLPQTGPAGTLAAPDGTVLFLPQTLFIRAAESRPQVDYSTLAGCYLHPGLEYADALRFTEAVYAYRYVASALPYPLPYTDRRHEDYFDRNFIPLELAAPGADKELAAVVNGNLSCRAAARTQVKNKRTAVKAPIPAKPVPAERIVKPNADAQTLLAAEKEKAAFSESLRTRIKRTRFIRKNASGLKIAAIAAAVTALAVAVFISDRQANPTAKGLSARQVCESLYTGMHTMNITQMQHMCSGSGTKTLLDTISGFYVTAKVRESMEQKSGTVTPEAWPYFKTETSFWIFGLTDFRIDGIPADTSVVPYAKKDKPVPVTEENGKPLQTGDTRTFNVTYYFVRNGGMDIFTAGLHRDTVTLTYKKNSWYVTDIRITEEEIPFETERFKTDYLKALEISDGYVPDAVESMRETYRWLPTQAELLRGAREIYARFNLQSAFDVLERNGEL